MPSSRSSSASATEGLLDLRRDGWNIGTPQVNEVAMGFGNPDTLPAYLLPQTRYAEKFNLSGPERIRQ